MNRTLKEATVKRYHYETHWHLKGHLHTFLMAHNFAKRLNSTWQARGVSSQDEGEPTGVRALRLGV